ncbi:hypothetical protein [Hymenobacter rubidus]|uniref:hypothetical protein n=1 Tax=Hymenobacter rubidus TaxID=1441626 RepID=UPI0019201969|nr:hypothetical protein [Hymenobacter rubidus]
MHQRFTQESDFRKLRDFGQKFSATFEFIGEHWRGLGRALLYIVLPAALLQGIVAGLLQKEFLTGAMPGQQASMREGFLSRLAMLSQVTETPYYWVSMVMGAVFVTLLFLTVYGYLRCCLRPRPAAGPIGVGQVWEVVKEQFAGGFASYFGLGFLVIVGLVLFFIPGVYLLIAFSLFYVVKVVEGSGFGGTVRRCLQLIKGKWWSTFGLLFVMSLMLGLLLTIAGGMVGGIAYALLRSTFSSLLGSDSRSTLGILTVITTAFSGLFNLLIYPPILLAIAFQYFNLVERRDGVGLRNMVDQLGQAPAAVQNTAYRPDDEGEY